MLDVLIVVVVLLIVVVVTGLLYRRRWKAPATPADLRRAEDQQRRRPSPTAWMRGDGGAGL